MFKVGDVFQHTPPRNDFIIKIVDMWPTVWGDKKLYTVIVTNSRVKSDTEIRFKLTTPELLEYYNKILIGEEEEML
jgi:hypothetical protein